jgi:aminoglycoside phosphotransferase (APT) family kinase protein
MAAELSPRTRRRLSEALGGWQRWGAGLAAAPEPEALLGGHSNTSVLLRGRRRGGRPLRLVLRLNGDGRRFGVDRAVERRVLRRIRGAPFAVPVRFVDNRLCFLVTDHVEAQRPSPPLDPDHLRRLGVCLARVHALPGTGLPLRDCSDQIGRYLSRLRASGSSLPPALESCVAWLESLPRERAETTVLCHGDPQPENVLWTDTGPRLLDWEYAGRADPIFDLAVLAETAALDGAGLAAVLEGYGRSDPAFTARLQRERLRYTLLDLLWWLLRDPHATPAAARAEALLRRLEAP